MDARLCICPHCNTVSVQEVDAPPTCGKCGSLDDIDWFNLDAKQLRENLQDSIAILVGLESYDIEFYLSDDTPILTREAEGIECPVCKCGTLELVDDELRCRGECGRIWTARKKQ